jgi:hypothetical protein
MISVAISNQCRRESPYVQATEADKGGQQAGSGQPGLEFLVSIQNVKVSKCERHIIYRVTKRTASQKVKCTFCKCYKTF